MPKILRPLWPTEMKLDLSRLLKYYLVADMPRVSPGEGFKSAIGTALGVAFVLFASQLIFGHYALVAAVGATAVIIFSMPHSPMAQPWSVFGGYLVAVIVALAVIAVTPNVMLGISISLALVVLLMIAFKCVHPPAGAIAIFVVTQTPKNAEEAWELIAGILLVAISIVIAAALFNKLLGRKYPQCFAEQSTNLHKTKDLLPTERSGITHEDLDYALKTHGTYVDVQESELIDLYETAISHAFSRKMNLKCGDIMARDVISITEDASLGEVWALLHNHKIKALPVTNDQRQVIGIVTIADFLRDLSARTSAPLAGLAELMKAELEPVSNTRPVREIMSRNVFTENVDTPVSALVKKLSDLGMHHVPIVNQQSQLVGMVTQSDLIASMYQKIVLGSK